MEAREVLRREVLAGPRTTPSEARVELLEATEDPLPPWLT